MTTAKKQPVAFLIWGEEFLVRKAADELVHTLVPDASIGLNLAIGDGSSPREIAQELSTLPLFPGPKVVLVRDPEFVASKKGRKDGLAKAKDAWRAGRRKEGARRVLAIAARAGWGVSQLDPSAKGAPSISEWQDELNIDLADADVEFLREVAAFCVDEGVSAPESDVQPLVEALDNAPKGHVLVVAASEVDPKNALVKWIAANGSVVEKKVATRLRDLDISEIARDVLKPLGKKLSKDAEQALKDRCGSNFRLLQSELEKLALYAESATISGEDVQRLVGRAREEEFFELSEALQKRDLATTLRYVEDALSQGAHPLQLLGTIASVVRTLIETRERLTALVRGPFRMSFDEFKSSVFPRVEAEAKQLRGKAPHPYAAYMSFQNAGRYSREELLGALMSCAETDVAIKSSANGRLVIERLLWTVCGKAQRAAS